jgi:putative nucleotidyltransferase with HDIG domain
MPALACAAFALPGLLLLAQSLLPGLNPVLMAPVTHVLAVVGIASVAALVALAAAAAALRRPRGEPVLLALGALILAVLFAGHGLATPGVLGRPDNPWVVRLPVLALAAFAVCQLLAMSRAGRRVRAAAASRPRLVLAGGLLASLVLVGHVLAATGGLHAAAATASDATEAGASAATAATGTAGSTASAPARPPAPGGGYASRDDGGYGTAYASTREQAAHLPSAGPQAAQSAGHHGGPSRAGLSGYAADPWQVPLAALASLGLALSGLTHLRRWRAGRDPVELALAVAGGTAAEAAVALLASDVWSAAWWDYHGLLLVGFGATLTSVWLACRRGAELPDVLDGRWLRDPATLLEHGTPEVLHALVAAVEAKHVATRGHSARVSALAVALGDRLGMSPEQLRITAQGALLHDIGKIGVPDEILTKAGPLTQDERARIEEHPVIGWEIVRQAPSLASALDAVRHHHERVDGTGYPDRLQGDDIPLLARVVAVADVYDALTSPRDYRPAWTPGRALSHMAAARGTHFDARCLDAFLELQQEQGHRPDSQPGQNAHVVAALAACHADAPPHGHAHPHLPMPAQAQPSDQPARTA